MLECMELTVKSHDIMKRNDISIQVIIIYCYEIDCLEMSLG